MEDGQLFYTIFVNRRSRVVRASELYDNFACFAKNGFRCMPGICTLQFLRWIMPEGRQLFMLMRSESWIYNLESIDRPCRKVEMISNTGSRQIRLNQHLMRLSLTPYASGEPYWFRSVLLYPRNKSSSFRTSDKDEAGLKFGNRRCCRLYIRRDHSAVPAFLSL